MNNQQPSININIFNKIPKRNYGFIYCYTSPSGKKYIGQTVQTINNRAKGMRGKGYRNCSVFYNAIKKYGLENFTLEILEEAHIDLLNEKEKEWIAFLDTRIPNGYNISEGGEGHSKKVYQYDIDTGEFIAEYPSLTEAARAIKVKTIQNISDCLRERQKSAHGYIWSYIKYEKVIPQVYFSNESRPVYAYHLDGTFYRKFDSITKAAKIIEGNRNDIRKCIKGQLKQTKNYIWKDIYTEKVAPVNTGIYGRKPVAQIDIQSGKIIKIFSSQSEAAKELGLSRPAGISRCCTGKSKSCAGFRWEIYEGSTTKDSENL